MGYGLDVARNIRDHDLVDLGDLISTLSRENQSVGSLVSEAIDEVVLHKASTLDDSSGLSVYFPYYNKERYFSDWKAKYESFGIGEAYTHFIRSFGDILIGKPLAEWDNLPLGLYFGAREERVASRLMNLESAADISAKSEVDDGIITAEDIRFVQEGLLAKVPLTTQQQAAFASARLMVMERTRTFLTDQYHYRLVYTSPALDMDADGAIRSTYQEQTLHVVDQSGKSLISEISYRTLDNGEIAVDVAARSGYGDDADEVRMVMTFRLDDGGALTRSGIYVYDPLTDVYEHRYAYDAERYPYIAFPDRYIVPQSEESGDSVIWTEEDDFTRESIIRYLDDWHLEFRTTSDTRALGVLVEITDTQNNRHYTDMRTINTGSESPDLIKGGLYPSDESMYVVFLDQYDNVMYAMPVFSNQLMEAELNGSLEALKAELAGRESRVTRTLPTGDKVTLRQLGDWIFRNTYGGIRIVGYVGSQSRSAFCLLLRRGGPEQAVRYDFDLLFQRPYFRCRLPVAICDGLDLP